MLKAAIHRSLKAFGFEIRRTDSSNEVASDFEPEDIEIVLRVRKYTMTSAERIYALTRAIRYISTASIPGDIVECGVWRGGSMAAVARTLLQMQTVDRELYLFDTFEGMTHPTPKDVDYEGRTAEELLSTEPSFRCDGAPLELVRTVIAETGYPLNKTHFVQGRVEDTIPEFAPNSIALLRLDTDWYASTKHELVHLFPRLSRGGVLIIDDYGHWRGSREACDEYFADMKIPILLNRIDYTGRIAIKG